MRTIHDLLDLSGRVALVTGGAGHIGSAIAEALAECGADIIISDKPGTSLVLPLGLTKVDVRLLALDLEHEVNAIRLRDAFRLWGCGLDILVNCAAYLDGPGLDEPFAEQTADAWDRSFAVNVRAPFLLAQACAPLLRASGHGAIINVASIYGVVAHQPALYAGTGIYCGLAYQASKAALLQLTRGLAVELAPSVRVNAIVSGGIARGQDAAFVERYCERVPLGRMGREEDIKGVSAWLASDASAYVTGTVVPVEGGWLAW